MHDYLDMIKNPNRKASTSPAPDPSNASRISAPFLNPVVPAPENPLYVNKLDKIKAVDLKSWGSKEETPSSRGIRPSYESPFDQIPRDPTPRLNRFSAPITSIGERATTPTQSLFGDIPPQPQNLLGGYKSSYVDPVPTTVNPYRDRSPRPGIIGSNLDTSPGGSVFGNSSGSSASNRKPLKIGTGSNSSGTGLFGDSSYKGSTQDSLSHRKNISTISTQPSSTIRFGDVSRWVRDASPRFENKDKSPTLKRKQKKKADSAIYILQALVVILVVVAVKVVFMKEHVVFCDYPDKGRPMIPGCIPCPDHGKCSYGRLTECDDKYMEYKDECVLDSETPAKFAQYRSYINDRLAYYKGERLCNQTIKDYLTIGEIKAELLAKYGNKESGRLNINFEFQWDDYFETEEGLVREIRNEKEVYITSDEGSPSFSCKCKLIWREGKLAGIWLVLFVATTILSVKLIRLHLIYSRLGKEMYEDVREYLTHFKNVSVKTLKKEFEHKHPGKNFEKIWSYVENYRKEDARIYQYFDIFQGVNQEFWFKVR